MSQLFAAYAAVATKELYGCIRNLHYQKRIEICRIHRTLGIEYVGQGSTRTVQSKETLDLGWELINPRAGTNS